MEIKNRIIPDKMEFANLEQIFPSDNWKVELNRLLERFNHSKRDNPLFDKPSDEVFLKTIARGITLIDTQFQGEKEIDTEMLEKCHEAINFLIQRYLDIPDKYSKIISTWVIGTYFHKQFETYPFLFINAMRGSGKTRLLKLLESLVHNGKITTNLSEAVLFRTAEHNTILIDEFESVTSKEKTTLKELLHSGYKKGSIVERMRKAYDKEGEKMVVEKFNVYTPVVMANIKGIDETLGDRCITIILEKSNNQAKTKLIEDFTSNPYFKQLKRTLEQFSVVSVSVYPLKNMYLWNHFVDMKNCTIYNNTYITYTTPNAQQHLNPPILDENEKIKDVEIDKETMTLFERIDEVGIDGRNFELFFPLMIVSEMVGEKALLETLKISKELVEEKRTEEFTQSLDVSLIDFISKREPGVQFFSIKELVGQFRLFIDADTGSEEGDINNRWFGNALKRLNLVLNKRRLAHGIEVYLDVVKAQEKVKMFGGSK